MVFVNVISLPEACCRSAGRAAERTRGEITVTAKSFVSVVVVVASVSVKAVSE